MVDLMTVRNKTIIGLKFSNSRHNNFFFVRNKTIIGLKYNITIEWDYDEC